MIKIGDYYYKLMQMPLPDRRTVEKLIKEIYKQGKEDERNRTRKRVDSFVKKFDFKTK